MDTPRIAIVHYHLRRGGVASVIRRTAECLAPAGVPGVILAGEPAGDSTAWALPVRVVEGLGYADGNRLVVPEALAERLVETATAALGGRPDIWHVHNHALGKNPALTSAVGCLAAQGERLLLQIHDFAEDGRTANFVALKNGFSEDSLDALGRRIYPQGARIHYALLNSRDKRFLTKAGWAEESLHLLANSVDAAGGPSESAREPLYLYPTRGIRRKNLGEFLLWAAVEGGAARFAVTLSPLNPLERPGYEAWKSFARELALPVDFEVGERPGATLAQWVSAATAIASTSVGEGFGLAFLEPGLADRQVCGRNLPEITEDFREQGVDLPGLYDRLDVPADWLDLPGVWCKMETALNAQYQAFGLSLAPRHMESVKEAVLRNGMIDFGKLDEDLQRSVLRKVRSHPELAAQLHPARLMSAAQSPPALERNRELIARVFGPDRYRADLLAIYRTMLEQDEGPEPVISETRLIEQFLAPERFCLLRV
ncbi:MAG: hypothetical protein V2A34_15895 [Lentisphaerota bacterium]